MIQSLHAAIVKHIREELTQDITSDLFIKFSDMTDENIIRLMFVNVRGVEKEKVKGLRLSKFGLVLMQKFFSGSIEVSIPEDTILPASHILFLDQKATLPYYYCKSYYVFFDYLFGFTLRLADGKISTLIEIGG